jgi:ubiquinone/menaquinone biosynthesis C-methylase UbiE
VSWYQSHPDTSLSLIRSCQIEKNAALIDVGAGASVLVDHLLDEGYLDVTVLDIAKAALDLSRRRLGARADQVRWQVADVTEFLPDRSYDLWHDRAVLHFLTDPELRAAYRAALEQALLPGGHLVVGTFAMDGPTKCSGLEIVQYDAAKLLDLLGPEFILREEQKEAHVTPAGAIQQFAWFVLQRVGS